MAPLLVSTPTAANGLVAADAAVPSHAHAHTAAAASAPTTTPGTPPHGPTTAAARFVRDCCTIPTAATTAADPTAALGAAADAADTGRCPCPGVELRPLEGEALGCEVVGLDLMAHPITQPLVNALRQALLRHQVRPQVGRFGGKGVRI